MRKNWVVTWPHVGTSINALLWCFRNTSFLAAETLVWTLCHVLKLHYHIPSVGSTDWCSVLADEKRLPCPSNVSLCFHHYFLLYILRLIIIHTLNPLSLRHPYHDIGWDVLMKVSMTLLIPHFVHKVGKYCRLTSEFDPQEWCRYMLLFRLSCLTLWSKLYIFINLSLHVTVKFMRIFYSVHIWFVFSVEARLENMFKKQMPVCYCSFTMCVSVVVLVVIQRLTETAYWETDCCVDVHQHHASSMWPCHLTLPL